MPVNGKIKRKRSIQWIKLSFPFQEVLEILGKLKPKVQLARHSESGSGWVSESFFTFSHTGYYYWIVIVEELSLSRELRRNG